MRPYRPTLYQKYVSYEIVQIYIAALQGKYQLTLMPYPNMPKRYTRIGIVNYDGQRISIAFIMPED